MKLYKILVLVTSVFSFSIQISDKYKKYLNKYKEYACNGYKVTKDCTLATADSTYKVISKYSQIYTSNIKKRATNFYDYLYNMIKQKMTCNKKEAQKKIDELHNKPKDADNNEDKAGDDKNEYEKFEDEMKGFDFEKFIKMLQEMNDQANDEKEAVEEAVEEVGEEVKNEGEEVYNEAKEEIKEDL